MINKKLREKLVSIEKFIFRNEFRRERFNVSLVKPIAKMKANKQRKIDENKYNMDFTQYNLLNKRSEFEAKEENNRPFISDYRGDAGYAGSYFFQDYWGGGN